MSAGASVCVCVRACVRVLRIVSRDKILRFKNTFIIIILAQAYGKRTGREGCSHRNLLPQDEESLGDPVHICC